VVSSSSTISNLIACYAELIDDGDFAGVGDLLSDATFVGSGGAVTGKVAIEKMFRDMLITYPDGTPRTHHATSNLVVDVDEEAGTASARSYVTIFQALPDLPLQVIAAGRYRDRFERRDGRWRFGERHAYLARG
jgi:hypothetical protein